MRLILILLLVLMGCIETGPYTPDKVLSVTQATYLDVRTVVTDPEVLPMFSPAEIKALEDLETRYLAAADRLKNFPGEADAIEQVANLATDLLTIINNVDFLPKVRPYVSAIRISIQLLRNRL